MNTIMKANNCLANWLPDEHEMKGSTFDHVNLLLSKLGPAAALYKKRNCLAFHVLASGRQCDQMALDRACRPYFWGQIFLGKSQKYANASITAWMPMTRLKAYFSGQILGTRLRDWGLWGCGTKHLLKINKPENAFQSLTASANCLKCKVAFHSAK